MIAYELSIAVQKRFGFCPETRFVSGCRPPQQFTSDHAETLSDADVVRIVRNLGGTEAQILEDEEMLQLVLPALRGDFLMYLNYELTHDTILECDLVVLGGQQDNMAPPQSLPGWELRTSASTCFHSFPGGHFFVRDETASVIASVTAELAIR